MNRPRYYVSLAFARYNAMQLADFAENNVTRMTASTVFTTPDPALPSITTAVLNLRHKQEATQQGGTQATVERDAAFDVLEGLLRELAAYVEDKAKNDQDLILSTGFEVTTTTRSQPAIIIPTILDIANPASGKLQFKVQGGGARAYEIWGRTGTDDFKHFASFTDPRNPVVDGLVPGALYDWKTRALYANNTYSDWSDVTSHRAT